MSEQILLWPILGPLIGAALTWILPSRTRRGIEIVSLLTASFNLVLGILLFQKTMSLSLPWAGMGLEFLLRLYHFSGFIMLAASGFGFLVVLYSTVFFSGGSRGKLFYSYLLLTLSMVNGAVLADNLVLLLFFWEGLLVTLFGMIAMGNKGAYKTALKAFIIVGVSDLCLMIGIGLTGHLAGTLTISKIHLSLNALGGLAFVLLMIGAVSKAGSMPFHSWIPDAAVDAPLPFMAFLPAALEKLLGIYFLTRISLDLFNLSPDSWASTLLMALGSLTILFAVMMALVQKNYKKLLSYHAISQVGYMILGLGTAVPAGIAGGLFHMINNALYKSGLFLTAGSVERQTGHTDLEKLGGLGTRMPITFACFLVTATAISGVPPFNGFFSKELIYQGALERGKIFYFAALLGSFLTAASFLKLGHAAFLQKSCSPGENEKVKEAPLAMLVPMMVLALICIIFGVFRGIPLRGLIQPILGRRLEGHDLLGPPEIMLVIGTMIVLGLALVHHVLAARRAGSGLKAADHIHHAPVLGWIYDLAEKRHLDPYEWGLKLAKLIANIGWLLDRTVDWMYEVFSVRTVLGLTGTLRRAHNGSHVNYVLWSLLGSALIIAFIMKSVSGY